MSKKNILIVEDEEDILKLIEFNLIKNGYNTTGVTSGEMALEKTKQDSFDLVLLDLMLPGIDGMEVCRQFKSDKATQGIPVIMLTAKGEEEDIIKGLESGADDYVTKPFSPKILLARVKTSLRRNEDSVYNSNSVIKTRKLHINPVKHEVLLDGKSLKFTSAEFKILHLLASRQGWVLSRYKIIDEIKGEDYAVADRSVDVMIVSLRKKLGNYSSYIETVRGVGYKFKL